MKVHEVLQLTKPMIDKIQSIGMNLKDLKYIELCEQYLTLKREGHKMTYIEVHLCEKFNIKKTKFYELVKIFNTSI